MTVDRLSSATEKMEIQDGNHFRTLLNKLYLKNYKLDWTQNAHKWSFNNR